MSRDHWNHSLTTEKVIRLIVDCNCIKHDSKKNFEQMYQQMEVLHSFAINGLISVFFRFGSCLVVVDCSWRRYFRSL